MHEFCLAAIKNASSSRVFRGRHLYGQYGSNSKYTLESKVQIRYFMQSHKDNLFFALLSGSLQGPKSGLA